MPTIIGRFNELLHNLSSSSSSSNSNPSSSTNTTTTHHHHHHHHQQQQQQHHQPSSRRHTPTRSNSSRTVSTNTTNNNNNGNGNNSRSNRGRNVVVKRSSSSSKSGRQHQYQHHQQPTLSSSSNSSSSTNNRKKSTYHDKNGGNHGGSSSSANNNNNGDVTNKCTIDSSSSSSHRNHDRHHHRPQNQPQQQPQHRTSSFVVSQCRHLSHKSSSTSSPSKRESNPSSTSNQQQQQQQQQPKQQQQSRRHQRRHSIASITSVSNANYSNNLHENNSSGDGVGKLSISSTSVKNNRKGSIMMATKTNNNNNINNNHLRNPTDEKNNNNNNIGWNDHQNNINNGSGGGGGGGGHPKFPVIMKPTLARNNSANNHSNEIIDESLASMLVRKMKIGAITRRGQQNNNHNNNNNNNPTQIFHKKIAKIRKKDVESALDDADDGGSDGKSSFIHRYLDGRLTKHHPDIISGKTCYDMPVKKIEPLETKVVAACTGPDGGLLTVNTPTKPLELAVDDVDFIDEDYPDSSLSSNGCCDSPPGNNSAKLSSVSSTVSNDTGEALTFSENNNGHHSDDMDKSSTTIKKGHGVVSSEPIAGLDNWNRSNDFAYGISTTLYESHPSTKQKAGDPIADSYGICVRENSAIIALADGVNWGEGACLASRCAINGCIDYLNKALYSTAESTRSRNTMDIFIALLRSFNAAHNTILSQGGHLTTLCVAVICQLKDSDRFIVCTCNVGDSLAYVYSSLHGVREITQGSHDIFSMRDMRDALGALGPVSGSEPELNNLTVAMTIVDVGDIVFLTSDGISDNFDPVVGKFAIPKKEQQQQPQNDEINEADKQSGGRDGGGKKRQEACENWNLMPKQFKSRKIVQRSNSNPEKSSARHLNYTSKGLPLVSAQQRHELTLLRMEDLIMNGVNGISHINSTGQKDNNNDDNNNKLTAQELCSLMVDFSTKLTMAKRRILEDPDLYSEDDDDEQRPEAEQFERQRRRRRLVGPKLAQVPGKLDHATIAAVEVGFYGSKARKLSHHVSNHANNNNNKFRQPSYNNNNNNKHSSDGRYDLKLKATLARFESQDSLESINEAGPI